jgi:hypothetical protein
MVIVTKNITVALPSGDNHASLPAVKAQNQPAATAILTRRLHIGGRWLPSAIAVLAPAQHLLASGPLPAGGVILSFRIPRSSVPAGSSPFLASLDTTTGKWVAVPSTYHAATGMVSARVTHFSIWAPLSWIKSAVVAVLKGALESLFNLAGLGTSPDCSGSGITVTDSRPDSGIAACGESAGTGSALAKIVNQRPYPVDLLYEPGARVSVPSTDIFTQLGEDLNNLSSRWHDRVLLTAGAEADGTVPLSAGQKVVFATEMDTEAYLTSILGTGIHVLAKMTGGLADNVVSDEVDAIDKATCLRDAANTATSSALSLSTAESLGSVALECVATVAKGISDVVFTVASIAASLVTELIAGIWGIIDRAAGIADHLITLEANANGSYPGQWNAHDYELCIGQALDFSAYSSTGQMPCSGGSTSGYERMWGCGYPVGGCGFAWIPLTFAYHADGTVTATPSAAPVPVPSPVGGAFYDDQLTLCTLNTTGKIVPCNGGITGIPPEGLTPGSVQLSVVKGGVLKETLPQGYFGGASYYVCSASASQADQQRYCPNG